MNRVSQKYQSSHAEETKQYLTAFAQQFEHFCILESNTEYQVQPAPYTSYDALFAIDAVALMLSSEADAFDQLKAFADQQQDWVFGALTYDTKNIIEKLHSRHPAKQGHPYISFFVPRYLVLQKGNQFELLTHQAAPDFFQEILSSRLPDQQNTSIHFEPSLSLAEYTSRFNKIQEHIQRGDIYEMNFCFDFVAPVKTFHAVAVWNNLRDKTHSPMSAYYRNQHFEVLCASPERFLKRIGDKLIAQPIKGTARRDRNNKVDSAIRQALRSDKKEQNENVMIVDLMRNDLSKLAKRQSVRVEDLFGVYTFEQVHQLISTVTCELEANTPVANILHATFPMGSMTGVPKVRAMQIIDALEPMQRGIYSGSIGYVEPDGNFDFNVVIRSLVYDSKAALLTYSAGSAITAMADAEAEYKECLLKAKVINEIVQ